MGKLKSDGRLLCVLASALLFSSSVGAPLLAQGQRRMVVVVVADAETGNVVHNAQVSILSLSLGAIANDSGRARLFPVPPGKHIVEARRIGYRSQTMSVDVRDEDSVRVVILLKPVPQSLGTVIVRDSLPPRGLAEFDDRMRRGMGRYITPTQLDSANGRELADLFASRLPGVRLRKNAWGYQFAFSEGGNCPMLVFVNGLHNTDGELSFVRPEDLSAVEYYRVSQIPPQYRISTTPKSMLTPGTPLAKPECGVLLLWTKR